MTFSAADDAPEIVVSQHPSAAEGRRRRLLKWISYTMTKYIG